MSFSVRLLLIVIIVIFPLQKVLADAKVYSIQELRHVVGNWQVEIAFLAPDGSIANQASGTYEFSWVVENKVLIGKTAIPSFDMAAGILFYINEQQQKIEMVSVGGDGRLWVMSGALGGDSRTTDTFPTQDGGTQQLRFTRYNVKPDCFESKMEYTTDQGQTWIQGNHQVFVRQK